MHSFTIYKADNCLYCKFPSGFLKISFLAQLRKLNLDCTYVLNSRKTWKLHKKANQNKFFN